MYTNLKYKGLFIAAVTLLSLWLVFGFPKSKQEFYDNLNRNIKLGLDLRGGSNLVLQIQVQDGFKVEANQTIDRMKEEMRKGSIDYASMEASDPKSIEEADKIEIVVKGVPLDKTGPFRTLVNDRVSQWILTSLSSSDYRLTMKPSEALLLRKDTVDRAMRTIENRINGLGLAESSVRQRGRADAEAEILVEMPGVDDPARVKQILQTTAMLELTEVKDAGPFTSREQVLAKHGGVMPLNSRIVKQSPRTGDTTESWYLVNRVPVVTGRDLRNARAGRDENGRPATDFMLSQDAARRFGPYTQANIGNRLAIILDNQVRSAPTINSRIDDNGQIVGAANDQEASDLALILRAGSLPAGIVYLEERTVGPSLGADSIRQGFVAGTAGLIAVVAAMLLYYKKSGVNATLALLLNALVLMGILCYFQAVLTLPGIAGIILTIGMAVDSNVLIFERIREELRSGKAVPSAIDTGFSRAFLTIIDTHVTTIVSCAFLFMLGTGPVKGFAVTLVIGLAANVFTSVFVSKCLFQFELRAQRTEARLSI